MDDEKLTSDKSSPAIAIVGMLVLGGLLAVPAMFIFYGAASALGGLLILGMMILCQSAILAIGRPFLGGRRT
jgi:hypothetical protein